MYKILILDQSEVFCKSLVEVLPDEFEPYILQNGEDFAQYLQTIRPDILVMDLMTSGVDALYVLEAANFAGIRPCVLAVSSFTSAYIERLLEQMKVSYYMRKPCAMPQLIARITDLAMDCQFQNLPDKQISNVGKVENFLRHLGFYPHLGGYKMLITAICLMIDNPGISLTKELYPEVARVWGTDWKQAEHAMRNCIANAYKHRNDWIWQMYFPTGPNKKVGHMKNGLFLSYVADYLRETTIDLVASL